MGARTPLIYIKLCYFVMHYMWKIPDQGCLIVRFLYCKKVENLLNVFTAYCKTDGPGALVVEGDVVLVADLGGAMVGALGSGALA